jgi:hypothetical protein
MNIDCKFAFRACDSPLPDRGYPRAWEADAWDTLEMKDVEMDEARGLTTTRVLELTLQKSNQNSEASRPKMLNSKR